MTRHCDGGRPVFAPIDFKTARETAQSHGWREKVLAYVTRRPGELLVLEHTAEYPDAGIQVPAGGVDPGEEPADAVIRELREETGLFAEAPVYLESYQWHAPAPSPIRHYYWIQASESTPDRWAHHVTGTDGDAGMVFELSFRPVREHGLTPGYGWESALESLVGAQLSTRS